MSDRATASSDEVARIEVGLLSLVLELHPEGLPADELIRRAMTGDPTGKARDYESALRLLQHAELVRESKGLIVPTHAALHFHQLPF